MAFFKCGWSRAASPTAPTLFLAASSTCSARVRESVRKTAAAPRSFSGAWHASSALCALPSKHGSPGRAALRPSRLHSASPLATSSSSGAHASSSDAQARSVPPGTTSSKRESAQLSSHASQNVAQSLSPPIAVARKALFPGKDYIHQLTLILQQLGTPAEEDLGFIQSHKARAYIRSLPHQDAVSWDTMYPTANRLALDLLDKMLRFCPEKRITVAEALRHPYLASLHDDDCEPVAPAPFAFDFEEEDLRENALRNRVYEEMELYHSGAAAGVDSTGAATAMES